MKHTILTALTAIALALNPLAAAPAQAADTKDVLGALLGIAAVAAIANEVRKDRNSRTETETNRRVTVTEYGRRHSQQQNGKRHRRANVLPGECLRVVDGKRRDGIVFPARCLQRSGINANRLPQRCETQLRTERGRIRVYRAGCLADAGWSLPRIAARR